MGNGRGWGHCWLLATLAGAGSLAAQEATAPSWRDRLQPQVVAGASVRHAWLEMDEINVTSAPGLLLQVGLQNRPLALFCMTASCVASRLQLTPHVGIGATHLRGIEAGARKGSFATTEVGLKLGYALASRVTPFVSGATGTHSTERDEGEVVNLWGRGKSLGFGLQWSITTLGRGVELAFVRHRGDFTNRETLDAARNEKVIAEIIRPFSAWSLAIGWSGTFTGVTWPWQ